MFKWYFKTSLLIKISVGFLLGVVLGLTLQDKILFLQPLGDLFVRLLKMMVIPLVFSSLVIGMANLEPRYLGRLGGKTVLFYLLTSTIAISIGLFFANIFQPGKSINIATLDEGVPKHLETKPFTQILLEIIPTNPIQSLTQGNMLQIIFFAILLGLGLSLIKASENTSVKVAGETLYHLFNGIAEISYLIVRWIMEYAPIGICFLIATVFAKQGGKVAGPLASITMVTYLSYFVYIFIFQSLYLVIFKISPRRFFSLAKEAIITAFVTRSSSGSLPVSMDVADRKLGISKRIYSFGLPLGATINMDGTAIYQGIAVSFIAVIVGQDLTLAQQFTIVITAVLASIGTAGTPGAGAIMLLLVLDSIGLNVETNTAVAAAYSLILGIDALLDMGRTGLNVSGDLVVSTIVAKGERELNEENWK